MTAAPARFRQRSAGGLSYERSGAGPTLVLLHGWCLSGQLWMYAAERLRADHDVVVVDQAGFGRSADLAGPYSLDRYAADLHALLEELGVAQAVVVGFAFGAVVAMAAAARDDRRIAGIVAIGVPSKAYAPYERMPRAMRRDWPEFARRSALAICKQPQSEATLQWLAGIFGGTRLEVGIETAGIMAGFDPCEIAPAVNVPIRFMHGAQDDVVPLEVSTRCAALAPQGTTIVIEDAGHLVVLDQRDRMAEAIAAFAAATPGGSPGGAHPA